MLLNSNDTLTPQAPSRSIVYRLLQAASALHAVPALKWQLARLEYPNLADEQLAKLYPGVFVRHELPFCGGEFSQRQVFVGVEAFLSLC